MVSCSDKFYGGITIGGLVNSSNSQVDVVQLALGEPHDSSVRKKAVAIAQERPSRYSKWGLDLLSSFAMYSI